MQGLVSADLSSKRVIVRAGTEIAAMLAARSNGSGYQRLANQGDIDTQAIAGALSTGTHGTGIGLGCLSSQSVGMRLVQPDGSSLDVDVDRDPEMMAAAQVSIGGMLGGDLDDHPADSLRLQPQREMLWRDDFEACLEGTTNWRRAIAIFSFFWCPVAGVKHLYCPARRRRRLGGQSERRLRDEGYERHRRIALLGMRGLSSGSPTKFGDLSHPVHLELSRTRIRRPHRKREGEALRQIRRANANEAHQLHLSRGISFRRCRSRESRTPTISEASVTVSVSGGPGIDYWNYLVDAWTPILRQYRHDRIGASCISTEWKILPSLYPRFHEFQATRRRMDPSGRFLNDHRRNLFE